MRAQAEASSGGAATAAAAGGSSVDREPVARDRINSAPEERMKSHLEHSLVRVRVGGWVGGWWVVGWWEP